MRRASTVVINCVFDQIPNLQNFFTTPYKNLGGEINTCRRSIFNKRQPVGFGVFIVIWSMGQRNPSFSSLHFSSSVDVSKVKGWENMELFLNETF